MRPDPRVLIVADDGDDTLSFLVRRSLPVSYGSEGCDVVNAVGGKMAKRILSEEGPFDVVLTDGYMPEDIDGVELMQSIRAGETEVEGSGTSRNVIIVLFTAWTDDEFINRIADARFDLILGMPLRPDMLIDYLVSALKQRDSALKM